MADMIKEGVHSMSEEGRYVVPAEKEVREHLEWFQDQKLGLMMHWAPGSQWGILESWGMCENAGCEYDDWAQRSLYWIDNMDQFRADLRKTSQTFNPVKFDPKRWANLAKESGFKYLLFTTKHHDGFCMYDTKYTDYKVTSPDCPFHTSKNADIVRGLYDAFREEGLGISVYFSKPDWDSPYYWCPEFKNIHDRHVNYDPKEHPELWEKYTEFVHNQIRELTSEYGKVDVLWLDGGWVSPDSKNQDIQLGKIVAEIRSTTQPHLIVADRAVGGLYENILTPEQEVPEQPILVPWESCISMGPEFSYRYHGNIHLKNVHQLIRTFLDIVARGGNLALNVTPQPDGELPENVIVTMNELGDWLKLNGEGIYGTRPAAPYMCRGVRYTQKDGAIYAFWIYEKNYQPVRQIILEVQKEVKKVICLRTGEEMSFKQDRRYVIVDTSKLPLYNMKYADCFKIVFK